MIYSYTGVSPRKIIKEEKHNKNQHEFNKIPFSKKMLA